MTRKKIFDAVDDQRCLFIILLIIAIADWLYLVLKWNDYKQRMTKKKTVEYANQESFIKNIMNNTVKLF